MRISNDSSTLSVSTLPPDTTAAGVSLDRDLYEVLERGDYCCVLAPDALGTLFRLRAADRLHKKARERMAATAENKQEMVATVVLNLAELEPCWNSEQWYEKLLDRLAAQLGLAEEMETYWRAEARLSPMQRWMGTLRDVVLTRWAGRLVIFVDQIDAVQGLPFSADEFFNGIRECYNRRSQDPELRRLTFCLTGSQRLSTLVRDPRTLSFNIGQRIEAPEWSDAEPGSPKQGERRRRCRMPALLKRAIDWISGEPYCCVGGLATAQPAAPA